MGKKKVSQNCQKCVRSGKKFAKMPILFGTLFAISGFVAAQPRFQAVTHEQAVIRHQQQLSQRRTNPHVGQDVDRLCS